MHVTTAQIIEFIKDDALNMESVMVTNRAIAERFRARHCRSGRIDMRCGLKEARGVSVHAYKPDGLGGIIALCSDGFIRQFCA